jgi:hypothetical protein
MKALLFIPIAFLFICFWGCSKRDAEEPEPEVAGYRDHFTGTYTCSGTESHYFPPSSNKPGTTKDTTISVVVIALGDSNIQFNLDRNPYGRVDAAGLFMGYHFSGKFYAKDSLSIYYMDGSLGEGYTFVLLGKKNK